MAQPTLKTKTERSIYARLHRDVEQWRSEWALAERNTKYAREAIDRWKQTGILEEREVKPYPNAHYTVTSYRLAPEWRDDSLIDTNLTDDQAATDASLQRNSEDTVRIRAHLAECWQESAALMARGIPDDDGLRAVTLAANTLATAARRLEGVVAEGRRLAARQRTIDAKMAERMAARAEAAPEGDPLGGDA